MLPAARPCGAYAKHLNESEVSLKMKRFLILTLVAALALCLAACASGGAAAEPEMTLEEQRSAVLKGVELPDLRNVEVTDENIGMYFFIEPVEGAETIVSEPIIGSIPHSVGLMRVPEGSDAEAVAANMRENMDPRKWICVEAEKAEVVVHGRTILLVMSTQDAADQIIANFNARYA